MKSEKKRSTILKMFLVFVLICLLGGALTGYAAWMYIFRPNIATGDRDEAYLFIPSGSGINDVLDLLENGGYLESRSTLEWVAARKNYHNNVRPGRYRLRHGMNNNELVNMLRSGRQSPVNMTFIGHRTVPDIASVISRQIEADSSAIAMLASDPEFTASLGFTPEQIRALFIPNTYELYWNTSAEQFYRRMKTEWDRFWNADRDKKREAINLSRLQVSILASIVSEETSKIDEMPVIAGVFLNRLRRGMPLQADPTIRYALGDFSVNRILRVHLDIDSPYNTYRNAGLPPGPISIPPVQAIEAVLNAENHDFLYFSAREDFSGYHRFARTLAEHNQNARLYQNALNQRRIFR